MISVHFNGEIVRHKNMRIIAARTNDKYSKEERCKYGLHYLRCSTWLLDNLKDYHKEQDLRKNNKLPKIEVYTACKSSGCSSCPEFRKRKKQGNKKKEFTIDWSKYRQLASAAHYLIKESENKVLFLTLTFPDWKRRAPYPHQIYKSREGLIANHKLTKSFYYDEISNIKIVNFLENMRENYKCSGYIVVKEYGETTKRVHFHLIISLPFIDFRLLNDIWVNSIADICFYSSCALRHKPGTPTIIRNPARAIRYVCKYIGKSYGIKSDTRVIFISRNLLSSKVPRKYTTFNYKENKFEECIKYERVSNIVKSIQEKEYNHVDYLKRFKSIYINTFEHVTVFKITDRREFNKLCSEFLYPLFECTIKPAEFYYSNPDKPG
jgi:hypothetical protein